MSILIFFISVILWITGQADKYLERPRISVKDGHLMFITPPFKNITFMSPSGVYINDMDLLITLNKAHNMTKSAEKYYRSLSLYSDRLDSLEQRLSEPTYVVANTNVSNITTDMTIIRRMNRRITALQRRVSSLESLLYKDECTSNPCKNGGICQDMFNGYVCRCSEGWEGPECDEDVNECARFAGTDLGCQNGATCINKPGSYECICIGGYVGVHCTRRKTDCLSGSHELCGEHGTCVQKNNAFGYKCICDQGYTNDGSDIHCVDVNECKLNHPPCSVDPPVQCINLPGSFYCAPCPTGFTGNGYHCIDIDECTVNNGGCSIHPMVTCINTRGSRVCGPCPPGYRGDGVTCTYGGGLCSMNNGGCHPLATCRENPNIGTYYVDCICPPRYIGNGKGPNGCAPSPTYLHPCMSNPCEHGTCSVNNTHDYTCTCNAGYHGRNCEFSSGNPCDPNPCVNGGVCQNIAFLTYKCGCKSGFYGKQCEFELPACGGIWRKDSGTVKYPPSNFYSSNNAVSCAWTLIVNNTKVLNITFKDFNLKDAVDCRQEFFEIHDGHNSATPTLGRFCGKHFTNGSILSSTHNSIYLWFRSTNVGSSSFELVYEAVAPKCGGELENVTKGVIQSPGFPGKYPVNRECYWKISSSHLEKRLEFKFFSLQIGNDSDCTGDYIEVFGEATPNPHSLIRKICNSSLSEAFYTPGPFATVHFSSNGKDTYPGFILSYSTVSGFPGCGGVLTAANGDIIAVVTESVTPCDFRIEQPMHSRIRITFPNFELTDVNDCNSHKIELYDGPTQESPLVGRFCGATAPDEYVSSGNQMFIVTQLTASKKWKIHYERDVVVRFTEPRGVFTLKAGTTYIIERPPGEVIEARVSRRDRYLLMMVFIEVRDGDNERAPILTLPFASNFTLTSTYNALWIKHRPSPWTAGTYSSNEQQKKIDENSTVEYTAIKLGCGGILKNKMGNIASPYTIEGFYPHNTTCTWVIIAPPKHIIQLSWLTFHLELSYDCVYDNIEIYDNNTHLGEGEMLGRYCGSKMPPVLFSSSNIMSVKFTSDTTLNTDGFLATYLMMHESSACGGNFFTSSGVIKSPEYPNPYPNNIECSWTINVRPGQQLLLTVDDFEMEAYPDCKYDYLEIRNGGTSASPLIGVYCGKTIPKEIPSHTNQLYLHFKSDLSRDGRGFRITWSSTATGCGGTLTSPSGSIMSPHYPEPYNRYAECNWRILVNAGSVIQAIFSDIDLEKSSECLADYVEVFDGGTRKSLGRYCSADNIKPVTSTKNEMLVLFRSDIAFQGRGFSLRYHTVCNNKLSGFGGVIESPNFPNEYLRMGIDCTWEVVVPQGNKINITFSHFDVASSSSSIYYPIYSEQNTSTCPISYVEISYLESEEDESAPFVSYGKYCGANPGHIAVPSSDVKIHFFSSTNGDYPIGDQFRLEWKLFGCGGHLKGNTGFIKSPNYPHTYPKNTKCEWLIEVAYGYSVEIEFQEIEVESDPSCIYDHVKVYNGMDNTYTLLTTVCNQRKNTVVSTTGNFMFIEFQSDYSLSGRGFKANYSAIPTTCGGKFIANEGVITSPNYPQNYNKNESCEWLIEVDESHSIEIVFEDVDLLFTKKCIRNYVKVFDGPSPAYPVLTTVCGDTAPNKTFRSTYNNMFLEFVSHQLVTTKGFRAKYRKACGSRISTQSSGIINVQKDEFISSNCLWVITSTDPTQHVSLSITHLESTSYCDGGDYYYDYSDYSLYDGDSDQAPLIKSYCGPKIPSTITSNGNSLTIRVSENIEFIATYSVFDSHCGGTFTAMEGYFSTPGYPKVYPTEIQCEWIFPSAPGNTLSINFIDFDLVDSPNCNKDFLEVRSKNASGKILGVYCGSNKPENLTHQDSLWILFRSSKPLEGETVTNKGFYAQYGLSYENEVTGEKGQIYSVMYPKMFKVNGEFSWRITVTERKKILLTFKEFVLDSTDESFCYRSKLNVYDGFDSESTELGEYCGITLPKPLKSSSNVMYLSAYVLSQFGIKFVIEWQAIDDYRNIPKKKSCGSSEIISLNSSSSNYTLTSPGYPTGYDHNLDCQWIFSTIPMNHLVMSFKDVNFGIRVAGFFAATCQYIDVVKLYQKGPFDDDWQKIKSICQSTSEVIHATNLLKVEFITTRFRNGTGFKAYVFEGCGGSLTEPSGYIMFGENSTKGIECQWNITVRSTRAIDLIFEEIGIPNGADGMCNSYLMVKNGISQESPFLGEGKYCGSKVPEKLTSTGNNLYVKYRGTRNAKFRLRYQEVIQGCGRKITLTKYDSTDEIHSPNYPNIPTSHTECHWIITAPIDDSVRIDFEDRFDLSDAKSCTIEYVEIRDGGTENSAILGRYCDGPPNSVVSTGNMMFVKYFTDTDDPKNGFKAKVSIAACGGTLRGTSGELTYKNKDNLKGGNCTWHLRGPMDHYWEIHFTHLSIYSSKPCEKYVSVSEKRQFFSSAVEIPAKYCGNKVPNNITTVGQEAIIQFIGNLSDSFSLHYTLKQSGCGGHLKQESGEFESPGYPQMNHVMRDCEWFIEVPEGRRVSLEFKDLDLDFGGNKHGIEVCDGNSFRNCESVTSNSDRKRESSSNKMMVYFYAIHPSTHRGFKANFSSSFPSICSRGFVGQSGVIQTPTARNYSYLCSWMYNNELTMNKTLSLSVSVNYDHTEKAASSRTCTFSSHGIRVYQSSPRTPLLKVCYTTPSPIVLRSPFPRTILETGISGSHTLNYTLVYQIYNCGGVIRDQQGEIKTPNYPDAPTDTVECAWLIEVAEGQIINLTAINLDLGEDCGKSFLSIYNGGDQTKPRISKTCRKLDQPINIISQSNQLFVEYKFEKGSKGKGVHLKFEASSTGCGGILHDRSRIIQTPNYGSKDYPNNAECIWELQATAGYHIVFQFQERFHIEDGVGCNRDFLEVWDWEDDVWVLQQKLCGREAPEVIRSKSDRLKLLFRSNDRITAAGFKGRADWDCGGKFVATKKPKYIVSPGYPIATASNQNCVYEITASSNFFHIKFLEFDLESGTGSDCQFDNVTISRKHPYFLSKQTYCGSTLPPPITMSDTAVVTLKTDKFVNGKGFKLMYSSEDCGGDIANETEIDYTSNINVVRINMRLPTSLGCTWNITAPPKQIVVLRILKLQLVDGSRCISNLQIFNGLRNDQKNRLGRFCGNIDTDITIHSVNNTMLVHLMTHPVYRSAVVFKAEVHFSHGPEEGCGGFINLTETTTIRAPYLEKIDCSWIIVAPRDHQIIINIVDTRLPKSCNISNDTCACAFLEIHDGGSPLADLIEKICKNVTNKQFTTYRNMAFIRLVHYPITQDAFRITLTPQMSVCGPSVLNVTNTVQTLTSPGYPYYAPVKCYYNFFDDEGGVTSIHLHFVEFDLSTEQLRENLQYITQCHGDTIEIIEDQDIGGPGSGLLSPDYIFKGNRKSVSSSFITAWGFLDFKGRHVFCGKDDKPFDYYTTSSKVALFFDGTKGKDKGKGFKLEYSLAGCNRNYTELQGRVSNGYNNTECLVSIIVPETRTISLYFNILYLKDAPHCENDALEVRDGSPTGNLLTRVCGYALPDPVFSYTNKVFIHIYSKTPQVNGMRYDISYTSTDKGRGCGGTLYGNKGRVFSPLYPHPFRNETTCTWTIRVPVGLDAVLKMMAYDLEGPCDKTYLNIVTHSVTGKATSTTLCPTDDPDVFKSESYITISYTSSTHNDGKGWEAIFQAVPKDWSLV